MPVYPGIFGQSFDRPQDKLYYHQNFAAYVSLHPRISAFFSLPITFNGTEEGLATLTQEQLPGVYTMAKGESRTGLLIFEVPDGYQDFSISYMEAFDDDSTGDTFFVNFTAETR